MRFSFLAIVSSLILNSYLGVLPAIISGVNPSKFHPHYHIMFLLNREAPPAYSDAGTLGLQEYAQLGILALVFVWLLIDWRRRSKSGPVTTSEPPFLSGRGTKKDPYVLESPPMVYAGGSAMSAEIITLQGINTTDIRTVSGPQFDISVVEQITSEDLSQNDHKIIFKLKLEDRDPDDLDEGVYEFMLSFKVARVVHFLWLVTIDYRRGSISDVADSKDSDIPEEIESSVKVDAALSAAAVAADQQRAEEESRRMAADQAKAKAAAAAALAETAAATKRQQAEEEARRASEAEAAERIKAMEAEARGPQAGPRGDGRQAAREGGGAHPGGREGEGDRLHHARDRGQEHGLRARGEGRDEAVRRRHLRLRGERQRVGPGPGRRNEHLVDRQDRERPAGRLRPQEGLRRGGDRHSARRPSEDQGRRAVHRREGSTCWASPPSGRSPT